MIDRDCMGFKLLRWRVRNRGGARYVYLEIGHGKNRQERYIGEPGNGFPKRKKEVKEVKNATVST